MNSTPARRVELSRFPPDSSCENRALRRRAADGARRRTPGLRREEVALLANIGATWYTRLEQGQPINVSADVLGGIARALRLNVEERRHLYLLAGVALDVRRRRKKNASANSCTACSSALNPRPPTCAAGAGTCSRGTAAPTRSPPFQARTGDSRNLVWRIFRDPAVSLSAGRSRLHEAPRRRAISAPSPPSIPATLPSSGSSTNCARRRMSSKSCGRSTTCWDRSRDSNGISIPNSAN